jgi:hypothetical protein
MTRFVRPVRMPLQTGATAFRSISFSFLLDIAVCGIWPLLVIFLMLRDARRRRASDVVLTSDDLTVEGGPRAEASWAWNDPALARATFEPTTELFVRSGDAPAEYIHRFSIDEIVIAETADPEENASIATLVDVIRSASAPEAARAAPSVEVAGCTSCGAPLAPADAEEVRCPFCGASSPMPTALRGRIRDAVALDRSRRGIQRSVEQAILGGSADRTNTALTLYAVAGHAAAPLVALVGWLVRGWLTLLPLVVPFAAAGYARSCIAHRRALRALVVGCAAITPDDPSHPSLCRACRAPLPSPADGVIVTCVYCGTANVLGFSLGGPAEASAAQGELETTIARQRRSLLLSRLAMAAALAAGILLIVLESGRSTGLR